MKIAWGTPWNKTSAIARYSHYIVNELAERDHEITIVRLESATQDFPSLASSFPVIAANEITAEDAQRYDAIVVNLGNNDAFHHQAIELIDRAPCFGIFHDASLLYLYHFWSLSKQYGFGTIVGQVERIHGPEAAQAYLDFFTNHRPRDNTICAITMLPWVAKRLVGAVAHSCYYTYPLREACPGPVLMEHLAYPQCMNIPALKEGSPDCLRILTVGIVDPVKCPEAIIKAISQSDELKAACTYTMAGPYNPVYREQLETFAAAKGVHIHLTGPLDDEAFAATFAEADVICCLRDPIVEGASASCIEGLLSGRPVIVADQGFFADLPDDMVIKIPRTLAPEQISTPLLEFLHNPSLRIAMGMRARAWAETYFTAKRYCDGLIPFLEQGMDTAYCLQLAKRTGQALAALGLSANDPAVSRVAAIFQELHDDIP